MDKTKTVALRLDSAADDRIKRIIAKAREQAIPASFSAIIIESMKEGLGALECSKGESAGNSSRPQQSSAWQYRETSVRIPEEFITRAEAIATAIQQRILIAKVSRHAVFLEAIHCGLEKLERTSDAKR